MPDSVRLSSRPRQGRSFSFLADILPASQWNANLRAERDLLRQLVPVISPAADSELRTPNSALALTVHDPHPDRLPLPENYTIEDANDDLF